MFPFRVYAVASKRTIHTHVLWIAELRTTMPHKKQNLNQEEEEEEENAVQQQQNAVHAYIYIYIVIDDIMKCWKGKYSIAGANKYFCPKHFGLTNGITFISGI